MRSREVKWLIHLYIYNNWQPQSAVCDLWQMHLLGRRQHIYKKVLNLSKWMGCTKCAICTVCVCYIHVMGNCQNPSLADVDGNLGDQQDRLTAHRSLSLARMEGGRTGWGNTLDASKRTGTILNISNSIRVLHLFREMTQIGCTLLCAHMSWLTPRIIMV